MIWLEPVVIVTALTVLAALLIGQLRWLRVAQRVQYLPGEVSRIERLWFVRRPLGIFWWALAIAVALTGYLSVPAGVGLGAWLVVAAPLIAALTPWRMPVTGETKPVAWTGRLIRVAVVNVVLLIALAIGSILVLGPAGALVSVILQALVTDLSLALLWPVERALQRPFLRDAQDKLKRVNPQIVAITGSYGKTTAKGYTAQILSGHYQVMASPASFNNLMGLSRSINDKLTPGTEVFVAEMGMNAEGRIRELSTWFPPYIGAITVIGEAHYERLGSHQAILRAKSEITENASVAVLPVDQPELVALADTCRARGTLVVTVSAQGHEADVTVDPAAGTVRYGPESEPVDVTIPLLAHGINIAVALGISWALDVPQQTALSALNDLPVASHRAEVSYTERGVAIIDDTYNSNPPGAAKAVAGAQELASERGGKLFVVTPGMVELGSLQSKRNRELGEAIAAAGATCYAVGLTNRKALVAGAGESTKVFLTRDDAVGAVLQEAGPQDVILYENDLPDHYP